MNNVITAYFHRRKRKRYHRCVIVSCRKAASYYGRFVGGLCTEHAREHLDDLWPEDQERLAG